VCLRGRTPKLACLLQVFKAGAFICDLRAMAHRTAYHRAFQALQDTVLYEIKLEDIRDVLANNPGIMLALLDAVVLD
jgi:hypothetical protein